MFYDEIIYLFLALILWEGWPKAPVLPLGLLGFLFLAKDLLWLLFLHRYLSGARDSLSFTLRQQKLPRLALIFFFLDIALLGLPQRLPGDLWALLFYLHYLLPAWYLVGRYEKRAYLEGLPPGKYLLSQVRLFLPALLPWFLALAGFEVLEALWPGLPDYVLWPAILGLLVLLFPYLAVRIWPTRPFPASHLRHRIEDYLRTQGIRVGEIFLWLPFGGRVLTAGILGAFPPFRYLLISPALLAALEEDEVLSVVAHEAGHVKRHHLLWLFLFLAVFVVLIYGMLEPFWFLFLALFPRPEWLLNQEFRPQLWPEIVLALSLAAAVILYFRYFVGYFLRNFERQADLYALESLGSARGIISSLEKIAALSGLRQAPSWHHYSLAERIAFLYEASRHPELIRRHHQNLRRLKFLFLATAIFLFSGSALLNRGSLQKKALANLVRGVETRAENNPALLRALGDYLLSHHQEKLAVEVYSRALHKAPEDPWLLNNLAWVLLTARDPEVRNPGLALKLARRAARHLGAPEILDTLAEAYFQNRKPEEACFWASEALERARSRAKKNLSYYQKRQRKFCSHASSSP